MAQYSEREIINGCRENNRFFQELVYRKYYSDFLKTAVRYAKSREEAEQLVHDAFIRILTHIDQYRHTGSFEGWMKRIVVNICLDYLKSKSWKTQEKIFMMSSLPGVENLFPDTGENVLDHVSFKELLLMIHDLPLISRTVFNLYVFDGFSHKEISERLNISEGTSSWHVHHARTMLRKKINAMEAKNSLK